MGQQNEKISWPHHEIFRLIQATLLNFNPLKHMQVNECLRQTLSSPYHQVKKPGVAQVLYRDIPAEAFPQRVVQPIITEKWVIKKTAYQTPYWDGHMRKYQSQLLYLDHGMISYGCLIQDTKVSLTDVNIPLHLQRDCRANLVMKTGGREMKGGRSGFTQMMNLSLEKQSEMIPLFLGRGGKTILLDHYLQKLSPRDTFLRGRNLHQEGQAPAKTSIYQRKTRLVSARKSMLHYQSIRRSRHHLLLVSSGRKLNS